VRCTATQGGGVTLPEDSARWEAYCSDNERWHARKQRRWLRSTAWAAVRAWGEEIPVVSESLGDEEDVDEEEGEGEVISSPRAPSPKIFPLPSDLFG
jgi:hypothetical protein